MNILHATNEFQQKKEEKIAIARDEEERAKSPKKQLPKYEKINVQNITREKEEKISLKPKNKNKAKINIRNSSDESPRELSKSKNSFELTEPPTEEKQTEEKQTEEKQTEEKQTEEKQTEEKQTEEKQTEEKQTE